MSGAASPNLSSVATMRAESTNVPFAPNSFRHAAKMCAEIFSPRGKTMSITWAVADPSSLSAAQKSRM